MNSILKKVAHRLRTRLMPTAQEKEVKRWNTDGGDERFRYDFDLCSDSLVFDLGGYKGQWASDIYARYNCRILVFEPAVSFANKIKARFSKNKSIEVFPVALGASKREEFIAMGEDGSSVFGKADIKEAVQFEDVNSFFEQHKIATVDLMKINIEGGEYELLTRLIDTGLIIRVKQIQVQFHDISKQAEIDMHNLRKKLSLTHNCTFNYPFVWENWIAK